MKAVAYTRYGPPEVLHLQELPRPVPKPNELLVRIHASEVTKGDCELRSFNFPVKWFALPLRLAWGIRRPKRPILGGYFSGVIDTVGEATSQFTTGDEVYGSSGMTMGTYGQYTAIPANASIAKKPKTMTFEQAAAVPLGGLNALHFLRLVKLQAGEQILINGAGGSIGSFGVQIAKSMGAHVTVVDAPHKAQLLAQLGADRFIDYTKEHLTDCTDTFDVVFDMVAGSTYSVMMNLLKPNGRYVTGNPTLNKMLRCTLTSWLSSKTATFKFAGETIEQLKTLREMIDAGKIRSILDGVYPMERAAEAHQRVESEARTGIVVMAVD
ncbi:MAG: NAD(P)-dependent alcohol dehydrogenase [Myxococcales bacterium]|nr:NAD(P)-dependent alcohol dehydrogenase [Myxococcales bacterium]